MALRVSDRAAANTANLQTLSAKAAAELDRELMTTGAFSIDQLIELAGYAVSHRTLHLALTSHPHITLAQTANGGPDCRFLKPILAFCLNGQPQCFWWDLQTAKQDIPPSSPRYLSAVARYHRRPPSQA